MSLVRRLDPLQLLLYGYLTILLIGFVLLQLPFCHATEVSSLDNLFVATSALSTTGLSTVDVSLTYSFWGQLVILLLIQLGGIGYMSLGSFFVLSRRRKLSTLSSTVIGHDFSLPKGFNVRRFVLSLIYFTVIIEVVGAVVLYFVFAGAGAPGNTVWNAVFHSISAFCTAGFSLFSDGFVPFQTNFGLNAIISVLATSGALGFIVFTDLFESLSNRKPRITYTSRIIIRFTLTGMLLGAAVLYLSDPRINAMAPEQGLMVAFFQSMTAFTTVGFNTYDIGAIFPAPLFGLVMLMIVGASPSGTGGGMKSTTFTALYAQLRSTFRGDGRALYLGRAIPPLKVAMATSNFFFYIVVLAIGSYLLLLVQPEPSPTVLFEVVSALGTVGLSTGLTATLSVMGKLFIIVLMFLGRVGPLTFAMAVFTPTVDADLDTEEDLAI